MRMTPVAYFAISIVIGLALLGYLVRDLVYTGFSASGIFFALLLSAGVVAVGMDLKRYRLTPAGLAVQHLITRRTRVIPYAAIDHLFKDHEEGTHTSPSKEVLEIRHDGRSETMYFFDRTRRDEVYQRLEACRQGELEGNTEPAELPRAQALAASESWIYPWRRKP